MAQATVTHWPELIVAAVVPLTVKLIVALGGVAVAGSGVGMGGSATKGRLAHGPLTLTTLLATQPCRPL